MTNLGALLDEARRKLADGGCESAVLDARLLLQGASGLRHEDMIADPDRQIGAAAAANFHRMVARRLTHEPVSRILGWREFYGRIFKVTPAVLDPRPDTETLIEEALKHMKPHARILDLGTGSGAIVLTLLAECAGATGVATDLSAAVLAVAGENALRLGLAGRLTLIHCNWFEGVAGEFDIIVSNPPYIPLSEIARLPFNVRGFDPPQALDGGPDGLEAYRRLAVGAGARLAPGGLVLVEIGAGQEEAVRAIFAGSGFRVKIGRADLGGHMRCLVFNGP
ncbi:MAG: peptide chain release factor N(5)-glutamine methyltransferase [Aestuariivirga sp.]